MPVRKTPPHKTLVRRLLASGKLSKSETAAFQKLATLIDTGADLDPPQKLWIETLNHRYLAKKA